MRRPILTCARRDCRGQAGLTLVELMVAMTISLLILAALVALFTNTSRSNREFARANGMIESGRLAIQVLEADVQHAGFWGTYVAAFEDQTAEGAPLDAPTVVKAHLGRRRVEVVDAQISDLEIQRACARDARGNQILDDFVLAVDRNRTAACKAGHVDPMTRAAKAYVNPFVTHALLAESIAHASLVHQVHGPLLEHTRTDAFDDVVPGAVFEDDRVDARKMQ